MEVSKANEELDQYEIESKEADIEIESLKMKIAQLIEEIKRLKQKQTIEEVSEENYDEEEDNKENKDNNVNKVKKNEIFCNKFTLYIQRISIRYKYHLFLQFKILKELGLLSQKYEDLMKFQNKQSKPTSDNSKNIDDDDNNNNNINNNS